MKRVGTEPLLGGGQAVDCQVLSHRSQYTGDGGGLPEVLWIIYQKYRSVQESYEDFWVGFSENDLR